MTLFFTNVLDNITVAQKAEDWVKILQNSARKTILAHKADAGVVSFVNFGDFRDQDLYDLEDFLANQEEIRLKENPLKIVATLRRPL